MRNKCAHSALVLLSAVLFSALILVVAQGSAPQVPPLDDPPGESRAEPESAQATILELSIPGFPLPKWYDGSSEDGSRGTRTLDLWTYTTYDDPFAALTYTSNDNSSYLDWEIVNEHFLSITVTTRLEKDVPIHVNVGDGVLTAGSSFMVKIRPGPYLDFYDVYGGYPLDKPLVVGVGKGLEEPLDLDYYSGNKAGESMEGQTFTVLNPLPTSVGLSIYVDNNAGPYDCVNCLDIQPLGEGTGEYQVQVQITTGDGLTATDTFDLLVVGRALLPLVVKRK